MSAASEVQAALVATLRDSSALGAGLSGIYDGAPARAAFPYLVIEESESRDWGTKDRRGREHRLAVTIWDEGLNPTRLHMLMAEAEAAIEAMPGDLGANWLASLVQLRTRIVRDPEGPWAGAILYRARTLEK